jgi:hypothetical protein
MVDPFEVEDDAEMAHRADILAGREAFLLER